jgi:LacI family transcriptional regulator
MATRERLLGALQHAHAEGWHLVSTTIHQLSLNRDLDGAIGEFLFEENTSKPRFDLSDLGVPQHVPWVSLADPSEVTSPQVAIDYHAVGDIAARHLRATGFQHFAFLGNANHRATQLQLTGFLRPLQRASLPCTSLLLQAGTPVQLEEWIASWVRGLPTQTAVHCASDELAARVSFACQAQARSIPNDVAVLGVGNDEWWCSLPDVPLSSIALPQRELGLKAAQLLSRLMRGDSVPNQRALAPGNVVARSSTLTFADAHPAAVRAIRFMREHAYRGISVQEVLDHAKLSRRSLENHVRAALGHAPHQELVRIRVERATHLLDTSNLPLQEIAKSCGFSDGRQMSETFRRHLALTPSQYRRRGRKRRDSSDRSSDRPSDRPSERPSQHPASRPGRGESR